MTTIILIRHGSTALNQADRYRGQIDAPLNDKGIEQAKAAGAHLQKLAELKIDAIYASSLSRAANTAEIIGAEIAYQGSVEKLLGLMDTDLGKWSGLTPQEAQTQFPEEWAAYQKDKTIARGGGKSHQQLQARAVAAIQKIVAAHPEGTAIAVTHNAVIKDIVAWTIDAPIALVLNHFQSTLNLGFTYIEIDPQSGTKRLVAYNLTAEDQYPVKHEQSEG